MNCRNLRRLGVTVVASGALLLGCTDAREQRLEGAQRALSALPDVEIIGSDASSGVLTVRSRNTGVMSTIDISGNTPREPPDAAIAGNAAASAAASAEPSSGGGLPTQAGAPAPGDARTGVSAETEVVAETGTAAAAGTAGSPAGLPTAAMAPRIVRDPQGRVQRIEGSGFSIERAPATPGTAMLPATAGAIAPAAGTGSAVQRRITVPIVCGAGETRALQGVELDVPGAGIVAERGCTLALANVRIRAGGWGLVVNPGASVRIDDSLVEGRTGALDLHPGGSLSAWATTFRGALGRPVDRPQFVDRGGNAWE
jgi:hypothetical protein